MDRQEQDAIVPVVSEELHADAIPVETGGVRVTKHVKAHDEILEQELRTGRVEVKRVKTDRVVDGPQPVQRHGNTLIIPVVSEVLRVEKQWVVTEEIHLIQTEERDTVQQKVRVNREEAEVERLDATGDVVSHVDAPEPASKRPARSAPDTLVGARDAAAVETTGTSAKRKVLSRSEGILNKKKHDSLE